MEVGSTDPSMCVLISQDGSRRILVRFINESGVVTNVEKWNTTNTESTTNVSGGGGYLHQGTGHIAPIHVQSSTRSTSTRHTRIYYNANGVSKHLELPGRDVPIQVGAHIDLLWYESQGIPEVLVGFQDHNAHVMHSFVSNVDYVTHRLRVNHYQGTFNAIQRMAGTATLIGFIFSWLVKNDGANSAHKLLWLGICGLCVLIVTITLEQLYQKAGSSFPKTSLADFTAAAERFMTGCRQRSL